MSKENFKIFVQHNPSLAKYVRNNQMSWQKFYELYDLYGENSSVWNDYLKQDDSVSNGDSLLTNLKNVAELFKGIDLKGVQKTLTGLEKAIGTFRDFNTSSSKVDNNYESRPINRYYED